MEVAVTMEALEAPGVERTIMLGEPPAYSSIVVDIELGYERTILNGLQKCRNPQSSSRQPSSCRHAGGETLVGSRRM